MKTVKDYIRTIPDFPHEGIMFRDVTTLFADPTGLRLAIEQGRLADLAAEFEQQQARGDIDEL